TAASATADTTIAAIPRSSSPPYWPRSSACRRSADAATLPLVLPQGPAQIAPGFFFQPRMEEIAQENAIARQQSVQEASAVEPEQPPGQDSGVLLRDGAVVCIEHVRGRAQDRHVAIQEVAH